MTPPTTKRTPLSIIIVDDETIVRESLGAWLREDGHTVDTAETGRQALRCVAEGNYDLAILDIKMPNMDGLELQKRLSEAAPDLTVVIMTAYASVETAVTALKAGAYDYIVKPFDPDELSHLIRRAQEHRSLRSENVRLKASIEAAKDKRSLVGESAAMRRVKDLIESVAPTDATVLIQGESGTGKELVAAEIHAQSPRCYNPMVIVHLGALSEGVLESELFGHEKGAFTGANYRHKGKFEQADAGTIFLDEIGEISPQVQVELLRVLEEKRVTRVGGKQPVDTDFRLVAATNRDLEEEVRKGNFREDLFYRLNVVGITIPPLRDRLDDIPLLAEHFLTRIGQAMSKKGLVFTPAAIDALKGYRWPGNARELQNAIERAVVLGRDPTIDASDLPGYLGRRDAAAAPPAVAEGPDARSLAQVEEAHIRRILDAAQWNVSRAATILGVDRGTLYHKIKRYGLERPGHGG